MSQATITRNNVFCAMALLSNMVEDGLMFTLRRAKDDLLVEHMDLLIFRGLVTKHEGSGMFRPTASGVRLIEATIAARVYYLWTYDLVKAIHPDAFIEGAFDDNCLGDYIRPQDEEGGEYIDIRADLWGDDIGDLDVFMAFANWADSSIYGTEYKGWQMQLNNKIQFGYIGGEFVDAIDTLDHILDGFKKLGPETHDFHNVPPMAHVEARGVDIRPELAPTCRLADDEIVVLPDFKTNRIQIENSWRSEPHKLVLSRTTIENMFCDIEDAFGGKLR